ncbi:MAG: tRNA (5-methylaminomethyl-2-thiouridine)(34)-methyltransferase MnmD [Paracoccaceae bacterium]
MTETSPKLEWTNGVPVAQAFDDPYYSLADGVNETQHVFLAGNDLPQRFRPDFHIAELGFGTGLNCLVALSAWRSAKIGGRLHFTSFERYPMPLKDMKVAHAGFTGMPFLAEPILAQLENGWQAVTDDLTLNVIIGDARETLPDWAGKADAWFLDGFSPAKNPELWEPMLMSQVARHTHDGGMFATYTAAGAVRRALSDAGFEVERVPGFGHKRHMTKGRLA